MSVKIIEERACDWCGGEHTEEDPVLTHALSLDKQTREVDLHVPCLADSGVSFLIEHGRKTGSVATAQPIFWCPICKRPCKGYMGVAQHLAQGHKDVPEKDRKAMLAEIRAGLNPG